MKKFLLLFSLFFLMQTVNADESLLSTCNKTYKTDADTLFLTTLSTLGGTGQFDVLEMQTKSGYILFRTASKDYVATVSKIGTGVSSIKILPANSNFSNGTTVQKAIFEAIDTNLQNTMKQVE